MCATSFVDIYISCHYNKYICIVLWKTILNAKGTLVKLRWQLWGLYSNLLKTWAYPKVWSKYCSVFENKIGWNECPDCNLMRNCWLGTDVYNYCSIVQRRDTRATTKHAQPLHATSPIIGWPLNNFNETEEVVILKIKLFRIVADIKIKKWEWSC